MVKQGGSGKEAEMRKEYGKIQTLGRVARAPALMVVVVRTVSNPAGWSVLSHARNNNINNIETTIKTLEQH